MAKNYDQLTDSILANIGGEANISSVTHCMTRLRFNLKDEGAASDEAMKNVKGVLGVAHSGGQYQIIIGQTVDKVYEELSEKIGISPQTTQANEGPKEKLTLKKIGNNILDGLAGSLTPLIPILVAASMFKMVAAILGPSMFGLLTENSDLYTLLTFVGDAGFYFFPVFIGYTAGKKFNTSPFLGMFLGAILIHPTLIEMAMGGKAFSVYGISTNVENYASSVIPIILSVWVMSYVEKFLKKYIPATFKTIFVPTFTIAIMLPIMLVVLAPAGFIVGDYISSFLLSLDTIGGFLAMAVIAALYEFLVMTGMHLLLITTLITVFAANGYESVVSPAATIASICVAGMCFGLFLRLKNKEEKALSFSFFIASFIGGVTEPGLYGLGVRYKKPFIALIIGGFVGGLYAGITGVTAYAFVPVASFLSLTSFFGGSTANLVNGLVACGLGFVVTTVVTYLLGVGEVKEEKNYETTLAES